MASQSSTTTPIKAWLVLAILSIIWGTSYILIKRGLVAFSPYQVACIRLSVSSLSFIPFLLYHFKKIDWSKWPYLVVVGLTGTAIPSFLFPIAQTEVSSSIAGTLNSLTPLFTLAMGILFFQAKLKGRIIIGVLIGLFGAALLILMGNKVGIEGNLWYGLFIVLATICYAISSNTVGYFLREMSSLVISAVSFAIVGFPAIFMLLATDFTEILQNDPQGLPALGYITILALFSTVLASIIFFRLIKWTNPVFASTISYLVPMVALFWGMIDGEFISVYHLLGMGLIFAGVYLTRQ